MFVWIKIKKMAGDSVSEAIICGKAKQLYSDLLRKITLELVSKVKNSWEAEFGLIDFKGVGFIA